MAPSANAMSKSIIYIFLASQGTLLVVLDPLKQMRADLNRANDVFALIQEMVLAYCSPFFNAVSSARRLWYLKHSWPIPPVIVNTRGVNVPCLAWSCCIFVLIHLTNLSKQKVLPTKQQPTRCYRL